MPIFDIFKKKSNADIGEYNEGKTIANRNNWCKRYIR